MCVGDCDGDYIVHVDELITGISIALGNYGFTTETCPSFDVNDDGQVTVDEIITAVSNALLGCGHG